MIAKKQLGCVSLALVLSFLWTGVLESDAQSFFGVPLFEGDGKKEAKPGATSDRPAPAKELPLEEWPAELSNHWAEYKTSRAAGIAKVDKGYIPKLQELKKAYSAADQLEDAIRTGREIERVEKEIAALEGGGDLPALDSRSSSNPLPADALGAYEDQMKLKALGLTLLNERYMKSVGEMKSKLTVADELGGALAAKRIIEVLQRENEAFAARENASQLGADGQPEEGFEGWVERVTFQVPTSGTTFKFREGKMEVRRRSGVNESKRARITSEQKIEFTAKAGSAYIQVAPDRKSATYFLRKKIAAALRVIESEVEK